MYIYICSLILLRGRSKEDGGGTLIHSLTHSLTSPATARKDRRTAGFDNLEPNAFLQAICPSEYGTLRTQISSCCQLPGKNSHICANNAHTAAARCKINRGFSLSAYILWRQGTNNFRYI